MIIIIFATNAVMKFRYLLIMEYNNYLYMWVGILYEAI